MVKKKTNSEIKTSTIATLGLYLRSKQNIIGGICITLILLVVLNFFTGIVSYTFTYARCLKQPITGSRFGASNVYYLPRQINYGPNMFAEYYCTVDDAKAAGLNPSVLQP